MTCEHCGRQVPEAVFCTSCGAHQGTTGQAGNLRQRPHHYAAHPSEHVAQPAVFTTLFPHLGHGRIHEFRYAFLGALVVLLILVGTGLVVAALLAAIFLVPIMYLVYLYEAQVYRDEPATVLGFTIGGGLIGGLLVSVIADKVLQGTTKSTTVSQVIGLTVVLPIVQLLVMVVPALALRGRKVFNQTVDGLVFGVASGLGFSVAEGLVRFSSVFTSTGVQTGSANWIVPLISVAALVPLIHGSASGLVTAGVWRRDRRGPARGLGAAAVVVAVTMSIAFYLIAQLMQNAGAPPLVVLAVQLVPVAVLLVYTRHLLHHSLLEEATDLGFRPVVCPNCHRHVVGAGFCPSCGGAFDAGPRSRAAVGGPATVEGV